ncbi:MAG: aminotransferase class I/II-fold pyridoxal phosphate-dependent enzyme [Oscillospiraceae bacterium]|nr:aminotransferase class I/II-fold pyridoxal phosphate-dependent enzyme [Oscillospiraceae bacterium]
MHSFKNDYSEGAHPRIYEALQRTNLQQTEGYGEDFICAEAAALLRDAVKSPDAAVVFLSGGTQANLVLIAHALRAYEGVIAPESGHINGHECGAVEATGHKILTLPSGDGKITAPQITELLREYNSPHVVAPRLVYISQATETGTVYTRDELKTLYNFCRTNGLYLYIDGARLGNALAAERGLTLADIANFSDAFTVGGTKNGFLFGEALIIPNAELAQNIKYSQKQHGAMLAKGRVIGAQFEAMFRDSLYFELAAYANEMGLLLRDGLAARGVKFAYDSPTNLQFPIFSNADVEKLSKSYGFNIMGNHGASGSVVRLVTSWATTEEDVRGFLESYTSL